MQGSCFQASSCDSHAHTCSQATRFVPVYNCAESKRSPVPAAQGRVSWWQLRNEYLKASHPAWLVSIEV